MAGVLAEESMNQDLWENIACIVSSYIVGDDKGCLETLALSYHHLPDHLKECFLYLGGFHEDFGFVVERLVWLWVAEGFVEEAENRSLEDTAMAYLMDLINRNLVIVAARNEIGDVEACKIHDLVRELCLQKAKEERFFLKIDPFPLSSQLRSNILYQQRRVFMNQDVKILNIAHSTTTTTRSLLCFHKDIFPVEAIARSFVLLRVLDLQKCHLDAFPEGLALLVHLRYLAISYSSEFPESICKLRSLQTLILYNYFATIHLPGEVQDLLNLRHLWSNDMIHLPYIGKPMNLQSISTVKFERGVDNLQKCFPIIKKLDLYCPKDEEYHFELFPYLETLNDMSTIQSLANLEVLELFHNAFMGAHWDACEQQFRQLKLFQFSDLNIKQWEACSTSFPCLKRLSLQCKHLEEIPLETGEIATLELIAISGCSKSLVESVERIQQEQNDMGNDELKITVDDMSRGINSNCFIKSLTPSYFGNRGLSPRSDVFNTSLDLEEVLNSIESIKVELITINIGNIKMDSSSRIHHVKTQSVAAGTSYTRRNPTRIKKLSEEIVVGLDHDAKIIRDKLTEDTKQLCVVSIVGMGGLGKTTLATKLFNDPFFKYHFHIRAWATVSQTYIRRDLLFQILASIGLTQGLDEASDSKLRGKLHQKLMGNRYFIVIDDIWSIQAWDELKMFFPHDNTASRILLTSRLNEVALHVKPHGFVHYLPCLTEEESWELLKLKVFYGDECPEWLIEPGRKIARKCQGLPLSVVVMAGVLATTNKDLWENIACGVGSHMINNLKGCMETLALSYHHLPGHLRECFLYLGGFPEDHLFNVKRLTWLWVAEGFIEEVRNQSFEVTAKAYLMDLIDRNLVIVARRTFMGDVKECKLHDLVRELCMQKAKEEEFFLKIDDPPLPSRLLEVITPCTQRRVFANRDVDIADFAHSPPCMRSLLCFRKLHSFYGKDENFYSLVLLRVLDQQMTRLFNYFPRGMESFVHLRYLAICISFDFPATICKLISLQTLIVEMRYVDKVYLPSKISNLVNLRHLWSDKILIFPAIRKSMNLQSISSVWLGDGVDNIGRCFPNIKKLEYTLASGEERHFKHLPYLENLKLSLQRRRVSPRHQESLLNRIWFPESMKKLTLVRCDLPWSDMSFIHTLPNLEVLKLMSNAFEGSQWDAREQQFRQLKLLKLEWLDIKLWEVFSTTFPCLRRLTLRECKYLEGVPLEIGDILTLELIETNKGIATGVMESMKRILKGQRDEGNTLLKIIVGEMELSEHEDSESE
ncbi:hypothetical protein OSB04_016093 [Centaurea solstitialis]|uniref:NB-ARC domain-containing protein n=1 Tax=Centaurea solstitialis TaxID=347529 RepID=A0AA38T813_9ASTR|nr:hypothetical protein OSB04_016093 [Centaurea solstitialis]